MADLRLVGVHEDGSHLLLSGPNGDNYLLPLDEALRTAVVRSPHHGPRKPVRATARMTPREIQSMIRAGSTAAQVAEVSGHTIDQIRRYEGPVLAERDYIASQARKVEVAPAASHSDSYRSTFGDNPATLDEMVRHRLSAFGIDPKSLVWNAWRDETGGWSVSADFEPGTQWAANSIGEPAPALWRFHPARKSLHNANRWAQQLSEMEPLDSPVPERRLSAVVDQPFDVEAAGPEDGKPVEASPAAEEAAAPEAHAGHGLLDMLRSRRGLRLGLDHDGDDELATMIGNHVPGAHPHDAELYADPVAEPEAQEAAPEQPGADRVRSAPFLQLAPRLAETDEPALSAVDSEAEVSTETREVIPSGEASAALPSAATANAVEEPSAATALGTRAAHAPAEAPATGSAAEADSGPSDSEVAARLERKAAGKPKRSSVPSWDQIVFGTKGD